MLQLFFTKNANIHSGWEGFCFFPSPQHTKIHNCFRVTVLCLLHALCKVASVHKRLRKWAFTEFVTNKYT